MTQAPVIENPHPSLPAGLYLEGGAVNPAMLAEILYRNTVALEALGPAALEALSHKALCDMAKTSLYQASADVVGSRATQTILSMVGISFALACLQWAGLPVAEVLDYYMPHTVLTQP